MNVDSDRPQLAHAFDAGVVDAIVVLDDIVSIMCTPAPPQVS